MDYSAKIAKIAAQHEGTITARDDFGTFRVEFEWHMRSAGFYDDMICREWAEIIDNTNKHVAIRITR